MSDIEQTDIMEIGKVLNRLKRSVKATQALQASGYLQALIGEADDTQKLINHYESAISDRERLKADRDSLIKSGEFLCAEREKLRSELSKARSDYQTILDVSSAQEKELEAAQADNEQILLDIQGLLKKQNETRVENFRLLRDCLAGQMHGEACSCDDCEAIPTALKHIDKFIADIE